MNDRIEGPKCRENLVECVGIADVSVQPLAVEENICDSCNLVKLWRAVEKVEDEQVVTRSGRTRAV